MEAVCAGKRWDVLLARDATGTVAAALPYLTGSKLGVRYVLQPQLTQYNGPWYRPGCDKPAATASLVQQLRALRLAAYRQCFSPAVGLPAGWERFRSTERRTYRIEDISNPERVYAAFDKSRRQRQIRRAEKVLFPAEDLTPEAFADFHAAYWQSRGERDLLSRQFIIRVVSAALQRGQGLLLGLRDAGGELRAARFVAFDENCAYALLSALHPVQHPNGASALLFWLIIQRLSGRCRSFDFEGSMDAGIAYSYSLYGAQPAAYFELQRCPNPIIRILLNHKK